LFINFVVVSKEEIEAPWRE